MGNEINPYVSLGANYPSTYPESVYDGTTSWSNLTRRQTLSGTLTALTTDIPYAVAIYLPSGAVVTNISFASSNVVASPTGYTNWWFSLYNATSGTPTLMAQTADQTTTAWAAQVVQTKALSAPQTITTSGLYYAMISVSATTPPGLVGASTVLNAIGTGIVTGQVVLGGTTASVAAHRATADATPTISGTARIPYVVLS